MAHIMNMLARMSMTPSPPCLPPSCSRKGREGGGEDASAARALQAGRQGNHRKKRLANSSEQEGRERGREGRVHQRRARSSGRQGNHRIERLQKI